MKVVIHRRFFAQPGLMLGAPLAAFVATGLALGVFVGLRALRVDAAPFAQAPAPPNYPPTSLISGWADKREVRNFK